MINTQWFTSACLVMAATALMFAHSALAAEPEKPMPSAQAAGLKPILNVSLRDAAIIRAKDGTYYLTGTSNAAMSGANSYFTRVSANPDSDFNNNDGVWLWKSADLKDWEPLGQVWSISRTLMEDKDVFRSKSLWQAQWQNLPGVVDSPRVRGISAPEIHQIKDTFVITYSMNGNGTGLLRSKTGKPEGPYEDLGRITLYGGDASIFEDDDGGVYWVWGNAWIARMKPDLTALDEEPRRMEYATEKDVAHGDRLLTMGDGGAFLFKAKLARWPEQPYHLVYYRHVPRNSQTASCDTFISSAASPYGPWTAHRMMVPHGGQVTVFSDGAGKFHSTFSGSDEWAAFRDKPGIVPLIEHPTKVGEPFWWSGALVKPFLPVTEGGKWPEVQPFVKEEMRDMCVLNAPDGYYYLTATQFYENKPREEIGIKTWRSKDMKSWEDMGFVWRCDDEEESRKGMDNYLESNKGKMKRFIIFDTEMHYMKGTYWLLASMSLKEGAWWAKDGMLVLLLKSQSGKPEGPYKLHWKGRHDDGGKLWTPNIFEDDDGTCYIVGGGLGVNVGKLKDDLSGIDGPMWRMVTEGGFPFGEGGHIQKIDGFYVHTTALGSGLPKRQGSAFFEVFLSSYDLVYTTAKNIRGPWSPTRSVHYCGNARFFQDKKGQWWAPYFGKWGVAFQGQPSAYPVEVKVVDDELIIKPVK